ncbi:MAG TPA: cysteine peptidase family C39 domain-containing protein [Candidatus Nanoarchaeia archaeon]|nr:hypothetical protein [uncultured archaeon]
MKLNVPLVIQPKDSVDCGLATINMVAAYHGLKASLADLKSKIKVFKVGTYGPQLGSHLLNLGFKVEIVTFNPGLFALSNVGIGREQLIKHLENSLKINTFKDGKRVINFFVNFLKDGGEVRVKIPDVGDIKEEINARRPLIALLTSSFLSAGKPKFNFHFNVITGIDEKYIYVNDPIWGKRGGRHKYLIPNYLFGMYASAYGDLDNPCLIKISKP